MTSQIKFDQLQVVESPKMISILVPAPGSTSVMRQVIAKGNLFCRNNFFWSASIPGVWDFLHKKDSNGEFFFFNFPALGVTIRRCDGKEPLMKEKYETLMFWALRGWTQSCNVKFSVGDRVAIAPNLREFSNLSSGDEDDDRWNLVKTILRQRFNHTGRIEKFDAENRTATVKMENGTFVFPIESLRKI